MENMDKKGKADTLRKKNYEEIKEKSVEANKNLEDSSINSIVDKLPSSKTYADKRDSCT